MSDGETVHIVDDDSGLRDSLRMLLQASGYACRLYDSAAALLAVEAAALTGCAIVDIRMPGMDGLALQQALALRHIQLPVIFMTGYADVPLAVRAMRAGAVDFVEKPCDFPTLREAIDRALARSAAHRQPPANGEPDRFSRLTSREMEVLRCLVAGDPNKIAAHKLGISARTVEVHRARVMEKTGAKSLSELVRLAVAAHVDAAV